MTVAMSTVRLPAQRASGDERQDEIGLLVDAARTGNVSAFGRLYSLYSPDVFRYALRRVHIHALAEDLTSETFLRAFASLASYQPRGSEFGAWLLTIARNLVIDHFRSSRTRREVPAGVLYESDAVVAGDVETEALAALASTELRGALQKLRAEHRYCLTLRFLDGLSIEETAQALGRTSGAVKQLQLRATRNLAKHLPAEWGCL